LVDDHIDVPRTVGYYGGVGAALALGLIDWPIAVFIGAIPLVKVMRGRPLRLGLDFAVQFFEGAAKPVGGDAEGTIQLEPRPAARPVARAGARGGRRAKPAPPRAIQP
jgi:hypothetical protein